MVCVPSDTIKYGCVNTCVAPVVCAVVFSVVLDAYVAPGVCDVDT